MTTKRQAAEKKKFTVRQFRRRGRAYIGVWTTKGFFSSIRKKKGITVGSVRESLEITKLNKNELKIKELDNLINTKEKEIMLEKEILDVMIKKLTNAKNI